jgi:hypothetical protein
VIFDAGHVRLASTGRPDRLALLLALGFMLVACARAPQVQRSLEYEAFTLTPGDLRSSGVAFLTPSSVTGREQDRPTIAFLFSQVLREERPDIPVTTLAETLSEINEAGLEDRYKDALEHMDVTGILPAATLARLGEITGRRYFIMLKLASYQSRYRGRFGLFGIRMIDTKIATLRLFYQIWDSETGSIAWEANQEMTLAYDTFTESVVTFEQMVEGMAVDLIARMPVPCPDDPTQDCARGGDEEDEDEDEG